MTARSRRRCARKTASAARSRRFSRSPATHPASGIARATSAPQVANEARVRRARTPRSAGLRRADALLREAGLHEPALLDREVGRAEGGGNLPRFRWDAHLRSG